MLPFSSYHDAKLTGGFLHPAHLSGQPDIDLTTRYQQVDTPAVQILDLAEHQAQIARALLREQGFERGKTGLIQGLAFGFGGGSGLTRGTPDFLEQEGGGQLTLNTVRQGQYAGERVSPVCTGVAA